MYLKNPHLSVPGAPSEVCNDGKAMSNNIKISWNAPSKPNGTVTGYKIYASGQFVCTNVNNPKIVQNRNAKLCKIIICPKTPNLKLPIT